MFPSNSDNGILVKEKPFDDGVKYPKNIFLLLGKPLLFMLLVAGPQEEISNN